MTIKPWSTEIISVVTWLVRLMLMEAERSIPNRKALSSTPTGEFMARVATVMPSQPYPGEKPMTKRLYTAKHWMDPPRANRPPLMHMAAIVRP